MLIIIVINSNNFIYSVLKTNLVLLYIRYNNDLKALELFNMPKASNSVLIGKSKKEGVFESSYVKYFCYLKLINSNSVNAI